MTNPEEQQILDCMEEILQQPDRTDRTGVGTKSLFGKEMRFDIQHCFPLMTTRRLSLRMIFEELMWILRGQTDTKILDAKNVPVWNPNTTREFLDSRGLSDYKEGDLGGCFLKDTKVLTGLGYKNIQDVLLSDTLMTHTGKFQPINNLQVKKYSGNIHRIRLQYHPVTIDCTPTHEFYCKTYKTTTIDTRTSTLNPPQWVNAEDLDVSQHMVGFPINTKSIVPTFHKQTPYDDTKKKIDTMDEWFMMGFFLGDRCTLKEPPSQSGIHYRITFTLNDNDKIELLPRLYVHPSNAPDRNSWYTYSTTNKQWVELIPTFAHEKLIPEWVQDAPKEFIMEFLMGYFRADRCSKTTIYRATTVSRGIAYSIQRLCLKLGYFANIQFQDRTTESCYHIDVSFSVSKPSTSVIEDGYAWFYIKDMDTKQYTDTDIYNFEVDTDNSYTVENSIVHNSYGFLMRHFGAEYRGCDVDYTGQGFDQLSNVIDLLKNNPTSRRIMMVLWNPATLHEQSLPPCLYNFQFYVRDGKYLSCKATQRSSDVSLAGGWNVAYISLLTYILAAYTDLIPDTLIWSTGDIHIYLNQIDGVIEQIKREPRPYPTVRIVNKPVNLLDLQWHNIQLVGYNPHKKIKLEMNA